MDKNAKTSPNASEEVILKTVLLLTAITLNIFEFFIPRIPLFPWLKPGLANCVTIYWIIRFGGTDALLFTLLRIWTVGFYFGFSFLTLMLAVSGGIVSTVAMAFAWHLLGRRRLLGLVGIGVIGALFHNAGQLVAVYELLAHNRYILFQLPLMLAASILFGALVSLMVVPLQSLVSRMTPGERRNEIKLSMPGTVSLRDILLSICIFGFCITLIFISNLFILAIAAAAATCAAQILERKSLRALTAPLRRFWLLFIAVAALHLFLSYGKRIEWAPFLTYEGVDAAGVQVFRLWAWLETASLLRWARFHIVFMTLLKKTFRSHDSSLYSGLLAMEYLPSAVDIIRYRASENLRLAFSHPIRWASIAVNCTFDDIAARVSSGETGKQ